MLLIAIATEHRFDAEVTQPILRVLLADFREGTFVTAKLTLAQDQKESKMTMPEMHDRNEFPYCRFPII